MSQRPSNDIQPDDGPSRRAHGAGRPRALSGAYASWPRRSLGKCAPLFAPLLAGCATAPPAAVAPAPATAPAAARPTGDAAKGEGGLPTGDVHDFDYFAGGWSTRQRRLKTPGGNDWEEFPATLCMTPYLGGMATVDELVFPTKGWSGLTLRTFDVKKRQWSIYWVSSRTGTLGTPVVGGFEGNRGEFYGDDEDGGRPVKVRYEWTKLDKDHARWTQAFSRDGKEYEVNWVADFVRADPATTCVGGRPRPQAALSAPGTLLPVT